MRSSVRLLLLIALSAIFTGCASIGRRPEVGVSLMDVRPTSATVFETGAQLFLRVTNESSEPLTLVGSSHRLSLNGSYVGRGVSDATVTVPPLGTATVTVNVYLENLALIRKFRDFQERPTVRYQIDSKLLVAGSRGAQRTVNTGTEGAIDLSEFTNLVAPR